MDKREFNRIIDAERMEMHAAANNLEWGIIDRMRHRVEHHKVEQRKFKREEHNGDGLGRD